MLGDRVKQIRKEKNLSQQAFATLLSTASGYISEIEKGKTMPGSVFLCSLKRVCPELDMNWLLTGERGNMVAESGPVYGRRGVVKEKIVQVLDDMDEEAQRDVLKYAEEKKQLKDFLAGRQAKKG
jgi:transcriptional regulator with XRE-family HTH domain